MTCGRPWSTLKQPSVKSWNRFGNRQHTSNRCWVTPGSHEGWRPFWIEEKDLFLRKNGITHSLSSERVQLCLLSLIAQLLGLGQLGMHGIAVFGC